MATSQGRKGEKVVAPVQKLCVMEKKGLFFTPPFNDVSICSLSIPSFTSPTSSLQTSQSFSSFSSSSFSSRLLNFQCSCIIHAFPLLLLHSTHTTTTTFQTDPLHFFFFLSLSLFPVGKRKKTRVATPPLPISPPRLQCPPTHPLPLRTVLYTRGHRISSKESRTSTVDIWVFFCHNRGYLSYNTTARKTKKVRTNIDLP